MITHLKVSGRADVLALFIVPLRDRIGRIAELELFLTVPDKLAG